MQPRYYPKEANFIYKILYILGQYCLDIGGKKMKTYQKNIRIKAKSVVLLLLLLLSTTSAMAQTFEKHPNQTDTVNQTRENNPPGLGVSSDCMWVLVDAPYYFQAQVTDIENDPIWINVIWGDGSIELYGPFQSGEETILTHSYNAEGNYTVRVSAYDSSHWFEPGCFCEVSAKARDLHVRNIRGGFYIKTIIENKGRFDNFIHYWMDITHIRTQETMRIDEGITYCNHGETLKQQSLIGSFNRNGLIKLEFDAYFIGLKTTKYGIHLGPIILLF